MNATEIIVTIIAAIGGSGVIVAALAAWLGKVWADRIALNQKLIADIDVDLRKRRIDVYEKLWRETALLPKWPKATDVTYERLLTLSETLRKWYFETGGMYLSRSARDDAYGPLQDTLADILKTPRSGLISDADYEAVRDKCSTLRKALANDIESRREGME